MYLLYGLLLYFITLYYKKSRHYHLLPTCYLVSNTSSLFLTRRICNLLTSVISLLTNIIERVSSVRWLWRAAKDLLVQTYQHMNSSTVQLLSILFYCDQMVRLCSQPQSVLSSLDTLTTNNSIPVWIYLPLSYRCLETNNSEKGRFIHLLIRMQSNLSFIMFVVEWANLQKNPYIERDSFAPWLVRINMISPVFDKLFLSVELYDNIC